jgi:sugar lactone lactonase YvrE
MAGVHQIWVLDLARGEIGVFAGTSREGVDDGDRRFMATLAQPSGITTDGNYLYWADPEGSAVRRLLVDGSGPVESLVGTGLFDFGDRDGDRRTARLQHPQGIAAQGGRLFVADTYNHRLKVVDPLAGGAALFSGSGRGYADGPAEMAAFDEPGGLAAAAGRLYVADTNNHAVRVVDTETGDVGTIVLSNLQVATPPVNGQVPDLEGGTVRATARVERLWLVIVAPPGYHLNGLAPGRIALSAAEGRVADLEGAEFRFATDEPAVTITVPARLSPGEADITGHLEAYYCRDGEEALCFIHRATITWHLEVVSGEGDTVAQLRYTLPPETGLAP